MKLLFFTLVTVTFSLLFSLSHALHLKDLIPLVQVKQPDHHRSPSNGPDSTAHVRDHGLDFTKPRPKIQVVNSDDKAREIKIHLNNRLPSIRFRCRHGKPVRLDLSKALRTDRPGEIDPALFELLLSKQVEGGPIADVLKRILVRRFRGADVEGGDRLTKRPHYRISGRHPRHHNRITRQRPRHLDDDVGQDYRRVVIKREKETKREEEEEKEKNLGDREHEEQEERENEVLVKIRKFLAYF